MTAKIRTRRRGFSALGAFLTSVIADDWPHAITIDPAPVKVVAQDFQPIRVERELQAVSLTEPKPGVYVYDFGQNFSGVESLHVQWREGTEVRMRFAEVLNPDGTLYTDNLRTAKATDHFIFGSQRSKASRRTSPSMASVTGADWPAHCSRQR